MGGDTASVLCTCHDIQYMYIQHIIVYNITMVTTDVCQCVSTRGGRMGNMTVR